jgi:hypothetical protein
VRGEGGGGCNSWGKGDLTSLEGPVSGVRGSCQGCGSSHCQGGGWGGGVQLLGQGDWTKCGGTRDLS